jgi:hypothetical protein
MTQITNRTKIVLCKTAVAAGQTDVTDATEIDMANWEGVRFIFAFGTITTGAATSIGVTGKATSGGTPGTDDIAGSKQTVADSDDDSVFICDIYQPAQRYLRPFVKRATQNAVVNSIIAELYGPRKQPVTQDATVHGQELFVSPANGTA